MLQENNNKLYYMEMQETAYCQLVPHFSFGVDRNAQSYCERYKVCLIDLFDI